MTISNVAVTDTFGTWLARTNQFIVFANEFTEGNGNMNFQKAYSSNINRLFANTIKVNSYINITGTNVLPTIVASFAKGNTAHLDAQAAFAAQNATSTTTQQVFSNANLLAISVSQLWSNNNSQTTNITAAFAAANAAGGAAVASVFGAVNSNAIIITALYAGANANLISIQQIWSNVNLQATSVSQLWSNSNSTTTNVTASFAKANTGHLDAVAAFAAANVVSITSSQIFANVNTTTSNVTAAFGKANTAHLDAQAAFAAANTAGANSSPRLTSLGVGTDAGGTGAIRATGDVTAFFSDERLKTYYGPVSYNPLQTIKYLRPFRYTPNQIAGEHGFDTNKTDVGIAAQSVQGELPEAVVLAPFDTKYVDGEMVSISGQNYLTVKYDRLIPLLVEAIQELTRRVEELESKQNYLK